MHLDLNVFIDVKIEYESSYLRTYRAVDRQEFSLDVTITRVSNSTLDVGFHRCDSSQEKLKLSDARRVIMTVISSLRDTLISKNQMTNSLTAQEIQIQLNVVHGPKSRNRVIMYKRLVDKYVPILSKSNLVPYAHVKTVVTSGSVVIFIKR